MATHLRTELVLEAQKERARHAAITMPARRRSDLVEQSLRGLSPAGRTQVAVSGRYLSVRRSLVACERMGCALPDLQYLGSCENAATKWWPRIPSDDCTVARGPTCTIASNEALRTWVEERLAGQVCTPDGRPVAQRPATRAAHGPSMGESLEPFARRRRLNFRMTKPCVFRTKPSALYRGAEH